MTSKHEKLLSMQRYKYQDPMNWLIYFVNMYILLDAFSHDYCLRYTIGLKSFAGILRWAFNSFIARGDIGLDKYIFERKIVNILLSISFNKCFGCSKEPSH